MSQQQQQQQQQQQRGPCTLSDMPLPLQISSSSSSSPCRPSTARHRLVPCASPHAAADRALASHVLPPASADLEENDEKVAGGRVAKQLMHVPVMPVIVAQRISAAAGQLPITQWQPLDDIT